MRTMRHSEWAALSGGARELMARQLGTWLENQCMREDSVFKHFFNQHATNQLAREAEAVVLASVATAYFKFKWDAAPPIYVAARIEEHACRLVLQLDVPRHFHDCDECVFLGQFEEEDLYSCEKGPIPTLIARFGDEGREYRSGAVFVGMDQAITQAAKRKTHHPEAR